MIGTVLEAIIQAARRLQRSSYWARLPPLAWAGAGAILTIAAMAGAVALFSGHSSRGPASSNDRVEDATLRLQITAEDGKLLISKDVQLQIDGGAPTDANQRFSLPPGSHKLQVLAAGYERHEEVLEARAGDHLQLPIQLQQASLASAQKARHTNTPAAPPTTPGTSSGPKSGGPTEGAAGGTQQAGPSSSPAIAAVQSSRTQPVAPPPPPPPPPSGPIHLSCAGVSTAGTFSREQVADTLVLEIEDEHSGRARLPSSLIPAVHGGVADGWVKLSHVAVTDRAITATVSFNIFDHPNIRVDRAAKTISISGWTRGFSGRCHAVP